MVIIERFCPANPALGTTTESASVAVKLEIQPAVPELLAVPETVYVAAVPEPVTAPDIEILGVSVPAFIHLSPVPDVETDVIQPAVTLGVIEVVIFGVPSVLEPVKALEASVIVNGAEAEPRKHRHA